MKRPKYYFITILEGEVAIGGPYRSLSAMEVEVKSQLAASNAVAGQDDLFFAELSGKEIWRESIEYYLGENAEADA